MGQFRAFWNGWEVRKNEISSQVFANTFWLACRVVTILSLTQRSKLGGSSRYLEHVRKVHRKVCRGLWKKVSSKKWGFVRIFQPHFELHFFKILTFFAFPGIWSIWCVVRTQSFYGKIFQMFLKSFLLTLRTCSRHPEGQPNFDLCVNKKIESARHTK